MFSECTTHYADSTRSVFIFKIMFITGTSTAAISAVFDQCRVSTFDIAFATGVSTAVVLQLVFSVSTSLSSVYVSLS